ncbi:hypothetical protein Tco_1272988, partial [Tanacetum coccineum]
DDTIDLSGIDLGSEPNDDKDIEKYDKKRKRKASSKPRKTVIECWKYFDPKFEHDENGVGVKPRRVMVGVGPRSEVELLIEPYQIRLSWVVQHQE